MFERIRKTLRLWQSAWRRRHDPPFTPPKPAVPSTVGIHASRLVAKFLIDTAVTAGADRLLARRIALHAMRACGEPIVMHHPTVVFGADVVGFGLLLPPMRIDEDGAMEWLAHDPMTRPPAAPSVLADLAAESVAQLGAVDEAVEINGMVLLPVDQQQGEPRVDPRELEFDPLAPMSVRVEFDPQIAPVGTARCYLAEDGSLHAVVATSRDRIAGLRKIHPGPWWLAAGVTRPVDGWTFRLREVSAVAGVTPDGGQPPWLPAEMEEPELTALTPPLPLDETGC